MQFRLKLKGPTHTSWGVSTRSLGSLFKDKQGMIGTLCCTEGWGLGDHFPIDFFKFFFSPLVEIDSFLVLNKS